MILSGFVPGFEIKALVGPSFAGAGRRVGASGCRGVALVAPLRRGAVLHPDTGPLARFRPWGVEGADLGLVEVEGEPTTVSDSVSKSSSQRR